MSNRQISFNSPTQNRRKTKNIFCKNGHFWRFQFSYFSIIKLSNDFKGIENEFVVKFWSRNVYQRSNSKIVKLTIFCRQTPLRQKIVFSRGPEIHHNFTRFCYSSTHKEIWVIFARYFIRNFILTFYGRYLTLTKSQKWHFSNFCQNLISLVFLYDLYMD